MWLLRSMNKSLSTGRTRYTQTSTPNGLAIRQGLPTCPLCEGSDSVPHMLLRCNNHTLKRMHVNRHHHAVGLCGEEISKGKLWSAIVTMDACISEELSDLNIESPDDIERNIPDWVFPTQLDIKAVQMACQSCPLREEAGIWIPNRFPLETETYILKKIKTAQT